MAYSLGVIPSMLSFLLLFVFLIFLKHFGTQDIECIQEVLPTVMGGQSWLLRFPVVGLHGGKRHRLYSQTIWLWSPTRPLAALLSWASYFLPEFSQLCNEDYNIVILPHSIVNLNSPWSYITGLEECLAQEFWVIPAKELLAQFCSFLLEFIKLWNL